MAARPLTILRDRDRVPEPWRNGAGTTRTVLARDGWRVSIATIEADAPFSAFPGVDRILTLLTDDDLELRIGGRAARPERFEPLAFDGQDDVSPVGVTSALQVLNVMVRRDGWTGAVRRVDVAGSVRLDGVTLLVAPEGGVEVGGLVLDPQDAIDVGEQAVEVRGNATVLVVVVRPSGEASPTATHLG